MTPIEARRIEVVHRSEDATWEAMPLRPQTWFNERFGLILKALVGVAVLVSLKFFIHTRGWDLITTVPVLTGLMGAVVFTMAILLTGVMSDFKESEKIVTELASTVRRLHKDLELVFRDPAALAKARAHVRDLVKVLNQNFRRETRWSLREIQRPIDAVDADLAAAAMPGVTPNYILNARGHVAAVVRIADRVEAIIETTFVKAGYYVTGTVVATALGTFMFTKIEPLPQGLFLYGFGSFLLLALFLLIGDLDNPFAGHARIDLRPMQKLEAYVDSHAPRSAPAPGRVDDARAPAPADASATQNP